MDNFALRLPDGVLAQIKPLADAKRWSINTYINDLVLNAVERSLPAIKPFINVNIQPGEDIIVQKRNSKGRFEKKS